MSEYVSTLGELQRMRRNNRKRLLAARQRVIKSGSALLEVFSLRSILSELAFVVPFIKEMCSVFKGGE